MGVPLGDLVLGHKQDIQDFKGKTIAIDAHNSLYQFLSIIRQPDGTPLRDGEGRITSHLSGLLYRTANLVDAGIRPVYVFDGLPPDLKEKTIVQRRVLRRTADAEWKRALEEGDMERAYIKATQSSRLTGEIVADAKRLLSDLGLPWVQAPSEGEAQATYMAIRGDVWAVASQDLDCLLFGSPQLIRNLTITGRRKLPRRHTYVTIKPELIHLEELLHRLQLDRNQLIDLAILVGTDFNPGVKGIGPKTALKLIKEHGELEGALRAIGKEIPDYREIRQIFRKPKTTTQYEIRWGRTNEEKVKEFLCEQHDFSIDRVKKALGKFGFLGQRSLDSF